MITKHLEGVFCFLSVRWHKGERRVTEGCFFVSFAPKGMMTEEFCPRSILPESTFMSMETVQRAFTVCASLLTFIICFNLKFLRINIRSFAWVNNGKLKIWGYFLNTKVIQILAVSWNCLAKKEQNILHLPVEERISYHVPKVKQTGAVD